MVSMSNSCCPSVIPVSMVSNLLLLAENYHFSTMHCKVIYTCSVCVLSFGPTILALHPRHRTTPASSTCNLAMDRSVHGVTRFIVCVLRLASIPSMSPCREIFLTCLNAFTCTVRTMYPFVQFVVLNLLCIVLAPLTCKSRPSMQCNLSKCDGLLLYHCFAFFVLVACSQSLSIRLTS